MLTTQQFQSNKQMIHSKTLYLLEKCIREKIEETLKRSDHLNPNKRGSNCSASGQKYELDVYNICRLCKINGIPFNTQLPTELAGSSHKNDINCTIINCETNTSINIGIEIKKSKTPDWMQCSIKYNFETKVWASSSKNKNFDACKRIFNTLLNNASITLFNGDIPPFMKGPMTHGEWIKTKTETDQWNDVYIDIPSDSIQKLYAAKGCSYIQISNGYGLYHLGTDVCKFNVPLFAVEQRLRIRTKVHAVKNKNGFCSLSVTAACQPKNIKLLTQSPFSLDNINKLPIIFANV
jgi:hypothetical protein